MKRLILTLFLIMVSTSLFAQNENYKIVMDKLINNYNADQYDKIFNDFSAEMQQALPLEKTKQFFSGLKAKAGKIESTAFLNEQQGDYAIYKTKSEKMEFTVKISLDRQNHISGLLFKPNEVQKVIKSNTVNALSTYPKEISEIIFTNVQNFPNNTQLSIAVIAKDKVKYYGVIKANDKLQEIENRNKVFEIGSITKVFTSTVLAALVNEGKIKLTDEINSFYPTLKFKNNIQLNFKDLANHTSGLPRLPDNLDLSNQNNPYKDYGQNQIKHYLQDSLAIENTAQKKYAYSNLGAGLLGYTLGQSQGTSFQTLLQQKIFDQYQMKNSFVNSNNLADRLVKGQNAEGQIVPNWDFDVLFGAGGILSTTEDLAKFAQAQFDAKNTALALTRTPTFNINKDLKIGLAWHLLKSPNGKDVIWHNGGTGGYSSSMVINVKDQSAVIVLSNLSAFHAKNNDIDKLSFELIGEEDK
ncbi:MAG: Beta-lactamase [Acinetobacter bereziniae]|uniref:Beta-lactamase n=1 Tax=Acinetobacter bereziniae TaxID=106648 RepID=A0A833UX37_ACIBZ|nr:MAG: Beta-lactamase [Acinetobacter bereziniae]